MMEPEPLTARDPVTLVRTPRPGNQPMTRIEFYNELLESWRSHMEAVQHKRYHPTFGQIYTELEMATKVLTHSYSLEELSGVIMTDFYRKEIDEAFTKHKSGDAKLVDRRSTIGDFNDHTN